MRITRSFCSRAASSALFAFLALAVLWGSGGISATALQARSATATLVIERATGGEPVTFAVEVAETPREKALGLMFRRELAALKGMLFPYPAPQEITMWMKNTYIPLDMLFIKPNGEIHRIEENTEPFSERIIASRGAVSGVLEIAGGEARRLGISPGDRVRHPHFAGAE